MDKPKYICVDLDGTIAHYKNWVNDEFFGEPIDGSQTALQQLRKNGWKIIIHTTRGNQELIKNYLENNLIPFDYINHNPEQPSNAVGGKPYADLYIDDRGIQFNGNWAATLKEIGEFSPWENRAEKEKTDEYMSEAVGFLGRDYSEVFAQLREYDKQIWEITKFSFLQLVGCIGAVWAIFALANGKDSPIILITQWKLVSSIVLIVSFLFSVLAIQYIIRIRVYFVATARYINDQRGYFLNAFPVGFHNRSGYYTNYGFPKAFDKESTQLLSTYFIGVVSSLNFGFGAGLLANYLGLLDINALILGIVVWFLACFVEIAYAISYLKSRTDKSTDADVFGIK